MARARRTHPSSAPYRRAGFLIDPGRRSTYGRSNDFSCERISVAISAGRRVRRGQIISPRAERSYDSSWHRHNSRRHGALLYRAPINARIIFRLSLESRPGASRASVFQTSGPFSPRRIAVIIPRSRNSSFSPRLFPPSDLTAEQDVSSTAGVMTVRL